MSEASNWEREFDAECLSENWLEFKGGERGTIDIMLRKKRIKQFIKDLLSEIETDILVLKANIPLNQGKYARKLARELLAKIE